ncbi:MAG: twin-arginine translocase TatA/TatE family subunit [Candidatus Paracaedibacteraceae bacterium]|nr:twin-arginine translocase TatA/TatE family subunit [Candidatus Paracaedibacteraceae bacterium]
MFDVSYSPWLILALVGLIFFRPDDWQELAFHAGRWVRRVRAYVQEWQEYFEFTADDTIKNHRDVKGIVFYNNACHTDAHHKAPRSSDLKIWPSKEMGSRIISMPPYT